MQNYKSLDKEREREREREGEREREKKGTHIFRVVELHRKEVIYI